MTEEMAAAGASSLQGACSCGAVRYTVQTPPLIVHCCHCSWCQRESGSAFAINGLIERDRITVLQGGVRCVDTPTVSGQGQRIIRCAGCQTALWSHYAFAGIGDKVAFLRAGTLDYPSAMPPDIHIFTASRQPWLKLPDGATTFDNYYRARDVWSEASLARKQALVPTPA